MLNHLVITHKCDRQQTDRHNRLYDSKRCTPLCSVAKNSFSWNTVRCVTLRV